MSETGSRRRWLVVAALALVGAGAGGVFLMTRGNDTTVASEPTTADVDETVGRPTTVAEIDLCSDDADLCIGVVTTEPAPDAISALAWTTVESLADDRDAETFLIESGPPVDHGPSVQRLADDGFQVIVTVGFGLTEVTRAAARAYPDIDFVAVGQPVGPGPANLATVAFAPDEAGELAGSLAALLTETTVVAAVLGSDLLPASLLFAEGFEAGAQEVNPDIETIVTYHPGDLDQAADDPDWATQATAEALANGADVVVEGGGPTGLGALTRAAESEGTFCIGVAIDRSGSGADACLVSTVLERVDLALTELVTAHVEGRFPSGAYAGTIELAPFGPFADQVPAEAVALLPEG